MDRNAECVLFLFEISLSNVMELRKGIEDYYGIVRLCLCESLQKIAGFTQYGGFRPIFATRDCVTPMQVHTLIHVIATMMSATPYANFSQDKMSIFTSDKPLDVVIVCLRIVWKMGQSKKLTSVLIGGGIFGRPHARHHDKAPWSQRSRSRATPFIFA